MFHHYTIAAPRATPHARCGIPARASHFVRLVARHPLSRYNHGARFIYGEWNERPACTGASRERGHMAIREELSARQEGREDGARAWLALRPGPVVVDGEEHAITVIDCGKLAVPSGRLLVADPFASLARVSAWYPVEPGRYPVRLTWDATLRRAMYVSLVLASAPDVRRAPLIPRDPDGQKFPERAADDPYGVIADAGAVCLVDADALRRGMPRDEAAWRTVIFDPEDGDGGASWLNQLDLPTPLPSGMASIPLPLEESTSVFLCYSGWGDGYYPILGGYDAADRLVAVHINLLLLESLAGDH